MRIVSWNLWGQNVPGTYSRDRAQLRGALPGSRAQHELDETVVWSHRLPLIVAQLDELEADVVLLQEAVHSVGPVSHRVRDLAIMSSHPAQPVDAPVGAAVEIAGLRLINVHLPLTGHAPLIDQLIAHVADLPPPVIVAGDFNLAPDDPLIGRLTDAGWLDATAAAGPTMPNPNPVVRLDYIFAANGATVSSAQTFGATADSDGFLPSDHLGVVADLQLAR